MTQSLKNQQSNQKIEKKKKKFPSPLSRPEACEELELQEED